MPESLMVVSSTTTDRLNIDECGDELLRHIAELKHGSYVDYSVIPVNI